MLEPGRSPKLSFPVAGPYPVIKIDGFNVVVRTCEGEQRFHLYRISCCPIELPAGVEWVPPPVQPPPTQRRIVEEDDSYAIDRLVAHSKFDVESFWRIRVRWASFGPEDDTWEPVSGLPKDLIGNYERRKKLKPGTLV